MRPLPLLVALAVCLAVAVPALSAGGKPAPVKQQKIAPFGHVLTTKAGKALYRWSVEQKAGNKIRCKASCLQQWPPLIVPRGTVLAAHRAGFSGRFGTIRRPDGRLQVTYRGAPLYSYVGDPVGSVLCDNEDGWFVVRA